MFCTMCSRLMLIQTFIGGESYAGQYIPYFGAVLQYY